MYTVCDSQEATNGQTLCHGCVTAKYSGIHNTGHCTRWFRHCVNAGNGRRDSDDNKDTSGYFKFSAIMGTFKQ